MPSRVGGFVQVYLSVYVHFLVFSVLFMMHSFFVLVSFVSFVMCCISLFVYVLDCSSIVPFVYILVFYV